MLPARTQPTTEASDFVCSTRDCSLTSSATDAKRISIASVTVNDNVSSVAVDRRSISCGSIETLVVSCEPNRSVVNGWSQVNPSSLRCRLRTSDSIQSAYSATLATPCDSSLETISCVMAVTTIASLYRHSSIVSCIGNEAFERARARRGIFIFLTR